MAKAGNHRGDENLVPLNRRTKEKQREIARAGGMASGAARRRKRDMQQALNAILDMPLKAGRVQQIRNLSEVKGKNITAEQAILLAMVNRALKGDVRAATFVRDTVGCKPTDRVELEEVTAIVLTDEVEDDEENWT
jgi:general stress protein YciG